MVSILATRWCPGISTFSVCSYFSLSSERKVSELTPLVDSSTIFKYSQAGGSLTTQKPIEVQHIWTSDMPAKKKRKKSVQYRRLKWQPPSQSTPPATFRNGGVYPATWGQLWNANKESISRESTQRPWPMFSRDRDYRAKSLIRSKNF